MDFHNLFNFFSRAWSTDSYEWLEFDNGHLYRRSHRRTAWRRFYQNAPDENFPEVLY